MPSISASRILVVYLLFAFVAVGCATAPSSNISTPTPSTSPGDLTQEQAATLRSLEKVDDYPLYALRYQGSYQTLLSVPDRRAELPPTWACSLFAALGDQSNRLYGRNFDWEYSPAVLLFTASPGVYASASMVDIAYLLPSNQARLLAESTLEERKPLLNAPRLPFDGMNEYGLVVGMAAVPSAAPPRDALKPTIGSLGIIRQMLDQARTVDEALAVISRYNIDMQGSPPLHYLIADASGRAALVEFDQGQTIVRPNEASWHLATNFIRSAVPGTGQGNCWRYDKLYAALDASGGKIPSNRALDLLQGVSQDSTQWSVVYGISTGEITITMGRQYGNRHTFHLATQPSAH